jgi:alpha-beta hydrolase superfamily lysophospholipase
MKTMALFIEGTSKSNLHVVSYLPEKPKGVVHILHGMGEHGLRYAHFAAFLVSHDYAVYTHDHRGHGMSLKPNQQVGLFDESDTFENIIEDVELIRNHIKKVHKDIPYYVLGHSMGSIILRRYLQVYSNATIEKAIIMGSLPKYKGTYIKLMRLMATFLGLFKGNHKRHEGLAKLLNDGLIKQIKQPITKFDWLTQDKKIVQKYIEDPLCGYAYNKRFYKDFFKTVDKVNNKESMLEAKILPTLFISGLLDPINTNGTAIEKLARYYLSVHPNYPLRIYEVLEARHEVLNELNKDKTYQKLLEFLNETEV